MMARRRGKDQSPTGAHKWIVRNGSSGRFQAFVRRPGSLLLRLAEADTEQNARSTLDTALRTPLANALIERHRVLPDALESRAFAARLMELESRNRVTINADELDELARRLRPSAHKLRNRILAKHRKTLGILLPGAADRFIEALDALKRDPRLQLAELGITARPSGTRGPKVRGGRAAYLMKIVIDSWTEVYGQPPRMTKKFARVFLEILAYYGERAPSDALKWLRIERRKLRDSTTG